MKNRNYGIDIFRILCCVGVLDYHIMDDVLEISGGGLKVYTFWHLFACLDFFSCRVIF